MNNTVRFTGWQSLFIILALLLVACTDARAVDEALTPYSPALKPAPTNQSAIQPPQARPANGVVIPTATPTSSVARPPTSTPVLPGQDGTTGLSTIPTATVPPITGPALLEETATGNRQVQTTPLDNKSLIANVDCPAEIAAYQDTLNSDPGLAALEAPVIAGCYLESGDRQAAITVYETAVVAGVDRVTEVILRQNLAGLLVEDGNYPAALEQYNTILAIAETDRTRGQVMYLAGQVEILAGNVDTGYGRFLALVNAYPAISESYQALTELIAAGYAVNDYQRGLVAYYAQAYGEAAGAFERAVAADPGLYREGYLYLAWSLEKLGSVDQALAWVDQYIAGNPSELARGLLERAEIQVRAGRRQGALDDYQAYLARYPQGEQAVLATWQSAVLTDQLDNLPLAIDRYLLFAGAYPDHRDADEAVFRAGYASWRLGEDDNAVALWQRALETYPDGEYGAAALLWLLKNPPALVANPYVEVALNSTGQGYYASRARHLASGVAPFGPAGAFNLFTGDTGRDYAENWLRQWLGLDRRALVAEPSGRLAADPRLKRGERLWSMGLRSEATDQFESLRADFAQDALASYQLSLYFRDLRLYRSSIRAALSVMSLAGVNVSTAPRFIARLAYPAYYADLVLAEAQRYGYDPLLHLALIREESLFDQWATSAAGARGLNQIISETGTYIAQQLGWPGYQDSELYRPSVSIAFGAYFLDQQLDRFGGNVAAALAAYNAGAGPAARWYGPGTEDIDIFLETVDFPETQRYIKQLYTVHAIYRFLYG